MVQKSQGAAYNSAALAAKLSQALHVARGVEEKMLEMASAAKVKQEQTLFKDLRR